MQACKQFGFEGLFPLDATLQATSRTRLAQQIFTANIQLIQQADLLMANLNPFRGFEPDSGTCFEIGYAHALGKPIWAYASDTRPLLERLRTAQALPAHATHDQQGWTVENFSLSQNLMLACSVTLVQGDAQDCLRAIAAPLSTP